MVHIRNSVDNDRYLALYCILTCEMQSVRYILISFYLKAGQDARITIMQCNGKGLQAHYGAFFSMSQSWP